jgi:hypothetical protein
MTFYVPGVESMGFDGHFRMAPVDDTGALGSIYNLAPARVAFNYSNNPDFPILVDNSEIVHSRVVGAWLGQLTLDGDVYLDRGWDTLINTCFGIRGPGNSVASVAQQIPSWNFSAVPYNGAGAVNFSMGWPVSLSLMGDFGDGRGRSMPIKFRLTFAVYNPNGVAPNGTTAPGTLSTMSAGTGVEGSDGVGLSSFATFQLSNGASSSPIVYDDIRQFRIDFTNQGAPIPAMLDKTNLIARGYHPGILVCTMGITQLGGYTTAAPSTQGVPTPLTISFASGDHSSVSLAINTAMSWRSAGFGVVAEEFLQYGQAYTTYGTSNTNTTGTTSPAYPMNAILTGT